MKLTEEALYTVVSALAVSTLILTMVVLSPRDFTDVISAILNDIEYMSS